MALVTLPTAVKIREDGWQQTDPRIFQQSEFTGRSRELLLAPAARWTCGADLPTMTADDLVAVCGFLAAMAIPGNYVALDAGPPGGQQQSLPGSSASCIVNGAGQLGRSISIHTLAPSVTHLRAGHKMTFLVGGGVQLVTLTADVVANGSGVATAQFDQPLRASPANGSAVALRFPIAWMRLQNPMRYRNLLANLAEVPTLQFEENF